MGIWDLSQAFKISFYYLTMMRNEMGTRTVAPVGEDGQSKYIEPWSFVIDLEKWMDFHQLAA